MTAKAFLHRGMEVRVKRHAHARRVTLRVKAPGVVHLVAPLGFKVADLPALLERHHAWLVQGLETVKTQQAALLAEAAPAAIELTAIGEQWSIDYTQPSARGRTLRTSVGDRCVSLRLGEAGEWREALRRWLLLQAKCHLGTWLEALSDEFGFDYGRVSIRGQRTRWGSCSANKTISLNYRLLFLPPEWVRYLLIHELCHTRVMNHSAAFWALVEDCEPDYRRYDKALRRAGEHLPAWLQGL